MIKHLFETGIPLPNLPQRTGPTGWAALTRLLVRTLVSKPLLGLATILLVCYAPGAVQRVTEAAVHHSIVSGAVGLMVGTSLLVKMAYTILHIPVTLLGLFVLDSAVLYGWISLGVAASRLGMRILRRSECPSAAAFLGTLGFILALALLGSIPAIGDLVEIALALVGLGAVSMIHCGLRRFVPETSDTSAN